MSIMLPFTTFCQIIRLHGGLVLTLMTSWAMEGVTLTDFVKQSLASESFPSRSNCFPFWRLACLRLDKQQ